MYYYDCGFYNPSDWFALVSWRYGFVVFPRFSEPVPSHAVDPKFRLYGLWGRLRQGLRFRPIQESRPRNMVLTSNQKARIVKCA